MIDSQEEQEGGSSQDKYESDFINDDLKEQKEAKKKLQATKGQLSSSDEREFEMPTAQDVSSSSEGEDPYENLPEGESGCAWRHNSQTDEYHLKDWFTLPAQQYNSLFEH